MRLTSQVYMAFSEEKVVGAPSKMLGTAFFEVEVFGTKWSKKESMLEIYTFLWAMDRSSARASSLVRVRVASASLTLRNLDGELGALEDM